MEGPDYVSRENSDGKSVEVWVQGWKVSFVPGKEPVAVKEEPPDEVAGPADVGEKVAPLDDSIGVSWGDRTVILRESEALVLPKKLVTGTTSTWFLRRVYRQRVD